MKPQLYSRRHWLQFAAGVGTLPFAWSAQASGSARARGAGFGKAKSVLLICASGGQSQLDTWDPKPNAPAEIRGIFQSVPTSVPGLRFCEHLPQLARLANRFTVVRNLAHDDLDHGSASYLMLTGVPHPRKSSNPPAQATDAPNLGSILARVRPGGPLPHTAVTINGPLLVPEIPSPGLNGGLLGHGFDPLAIGDVANQAVSMRGLDPQPDVPADRMEARRALLRQIDQNNSPIYDKAFALLSSRNCQRAFDLSREPMALRERYGMHRAGQACLLGRRLVEAGVPWVSVLFNHNIRGQDKHPDTTDWYGWDTHNDIFDSLKTHLLPRFDATFSTLLLDLEARGLLDTTLVICQGEFGRAPRIALERTFAGSTPGRKHWAGVYSIVMAGAGVSRGGVVGASDRIGAYPNGPSYGPWDVAATAFAAIGIDPGSHYLDPLSRPYPLTTGKPMTEVYG